jgi:GNAT superfamily N-acetyltransferase
VRRRLPGGFELDDDPGRVDLDAVHAFISRESYWARGRPKDVMRAALQGSARVLGLYLGDEQVGFARAVSDAATFAYLADVYVLPGHRRRGLGLELVREIVDGGPRWNVRWVLNTADAQALYAKLGFTEKPLTHPLMERARSADARSGSDAARSDAARSASAAARSDADSLGRP